MSLVILNSKQITSEIFNRILKLIQECIIRHVDWNSENPYLVKLPKEEFCQKFRDTINVNINIEHALTSAQKVFEASGWEIAASGEDWESSEFLLCLDTKASRNAMMDKIVEELASGEKKVAQISRESHDGSSGFLLSLGKRVALTDETPLEKEEGGSEKKRANKASLDV